MASISQINVNGTTYDIADASVLPVTDTYDTTLANPISSTGVADALSTLATVASSGNYSDLSDTPTLATVATSGSYNDLSNKPTIPTVPNITYGTSDPSDGSNGDIYIKYEV